MGIIDNTSGNTMKNKVTEFLSKSNAMDALVGYFYFSGFEQIYKKLKNKKIRILIGMDIDRQILEKISSAKNDLDNYLITPGKTSRSMVGQQYIEDFAKVFNDTDEFDSKEAVSAFEIFLSKMKDGSLEIKKTIEPNHAKNYIFHFKSEFQNNGKSPGVIIEGSSNFSFSGFEGQRERNRVLTEKHHYEDDIKYFENEWNNPDNILITDITIAEHFIEELKKKIWLYQLPAPELLYYRVLDEYYSIDEQEDVKMPGEITNGKFIDLQYQKDAIQKSINRINHFGGVIIADVVGLGKSIIASTIAHNMNLAAIIIAPPHLKAQWEDYAAEFNFQAHVYSTGKIEEALKRHGQLDRKLLVILDEAHKHRNEDTENYKSLHKLCAGNYVMALSATPFNNDPKDIYALIKLFTTPGKSTIKTVENLSIAFNELFTRYKKARRNLREAKSDVEVKSVDNEMKSIAEMLRMMITPLVIRRSRLDLKEIDDYREDLNRQGIEFADVEAPETLEYELGEVSELYLNTLNKISPDSDKTSESHFDGVRYKPAKYIDINSKTIKELLKKINNNDDDSEIESDKQKLQQITQAQVNIAKFMRRLLVRRFESSVEAFRISLNNMIVSAEAMLDWYENRKEVPIYKKGSLPSTEDLEELSKSELKQTIDNLENKGLIRVPVSEIKKGFKNDLIADIELLKEVKTEWQDVSDPKFEYFVKKIKELLKENKKRKIIIFTEFADTADYLAGRVKKEYNDLRVFKYTAADANKKNKQIINENFDAGLDEKLQKDNFDILIATDAISEGYNLHRAGVIINYDIPYNPTRVIQRVGRINRINKKVFDKLHLFNFFPTFTGELEIKAKTISLFKKRIIDAVLGDDTKIFSEDEELQNFFAKQYAEEKAKTDGTSWDTKFYNDWRKFRQDDTLVNEVRKIPHRVRIARKSDKIQGALVFAKRNDSFVFAFGKTSETAQIISPEKALPMFNGENVVDEKAEETTTNFNPIYQVAKEHIFKDNTVAKVKTGKNKENALKKIKILVKELPAVNEYAKDLEKVIKELDGLPIALLKEVARIKIKKDPNRAYETIQELIPVDYIEKIMQTAERAEGDGKLVLLSEEFIAE